MRLKDRICHEIRGDHISTSLMRHGIDSLLLDIMLDEFLVIESHYACAILYSINSSIIRKN